MIKLKERLMGTCDLQQVGQKHREQPRLVIGIGCGGSLGGLSPSPVKDAVSRYIVSEGLKL